MIIKTRLFNLTNMAINSHLYQLIQSNKNDVSKYVTFLPPIPSLSLPLVQTIAEFDLRTVNYEVKSPKCHELSLAVPPHDHISFNFRSEQEAQEWATVVMSSLREAQRG